MYPCRHARPDNNKRAGLILKSLRDYTLIRNGDGVVPKIHFEENEWGYWIQSFNNHSSVIGYIAIYEDKISVKWNDTTYWYEGVNTEKVLATLLLTQSLGKVANYIKKHGRVTAKWANGK
jgi:hypothetical protein